MTVVESKPERSARTISTWWIFAGIGLLFVVYGVYASTLPSLQPSHWEDITSSEETAKYIKDTFRWIGILSMGLGVTTIVVAYGGFRNGEKWAWFCFWAYPFFFVLAIFFTWPGLLWTVLLAASIVGLWVPYREILGRSAN